MYNLPIDSFINIFWGNKEPVDVDSLLIDFFTRVQEHIGTPIFSEKRPKKCPMTKRCPKAATHLYKQSYEIRLNQKTKVFVALQYQDCDGYFRLSVLGEDPVAYPKDPHQYLWYVCVYVLSNLILKESMSEIYISSLINYSKSCATEKDIKDYFFELSQPDSYTNIQDFIINPYQEAKNMGFPACWLLE